MTTIEYPPLSSQALIEAHPGRKIVAIVPAHNEEDGIVKTVQSLLAQDTALAAVIVMADNCTDRTVELAEAAGAVVIETYANSAKKAGALNQGLARVLPLMSDDDYVLAMDADGELGPTFVTTALEIYSERPNLGGLSGSIVARPATNVIELLQAIEYARGTRLASRNSGKVHVLSGAAAVFPARVLSQIARSRGPHLPGVPGQIYPHDSLTEDYELTLAIKTLGYEASMSRRLPVVTDIMPDREALVAQRLRWYRGALESVSTYGWSRLTDRIWLGIGWTFLSSLMLPLTLVALTIGLVVFNVGLDLRWMILIVPMIAEAVVVARRVSWQAVALSIMFVPLWLYDYFMYSIYWRALVHAVRGRARIWIT